MFRNIHQYGFVALFVGLFLLPLLQWIHPFYTEPPLGGVAVPAEIKPLTTSSLINGEYFKSVEDWYGENFGFRKKLVKIENQMNYNVFGDFPKMYRGKVIVGRDGWLFQGSYIPGNVKGNSLAVDDTRIAVWRLRRLQDYLDSYNIPLMLVIAPLKSSVFPEMLPPSILKYSRPENLSFYDALLPILDEFGIRYFDAVAEARRLKEEKTIFPIFTPEGTHWSFSFAAHCVKQITDQLNPLTHNRFPEFEVDYSRKENPFWADIDLRVLANLTYTRYSDKPIHYPTVRIKEKPESKPNLAIVGDSYSHTVVNCLGGVFGPEPVTETTELYYYFKTKQISPAEESVTVNQDNFDLMRDILTEKNALLIVTCESALFDLGFGFIETVFKDEINASN